MKKSRFTDEQIIGALKKLDGGISAKDVARDLGVNIQTLYRWRKKFGG
ncbi:MAG: transposase, partial [bacterium]|nr:transposase [bacterium]